MSTQQTDPVVIVSAARTPMGAFQSDFASLSAHDLGGVAIKAAVQRAGIAPELVTEVLWQLPDGGPGSGPRSPGCLQGRVAQERRCCHP